MRLEEVSCGWSLTCVVVAGDGVDEFVDMHQRNGDVVALTGHRVNHLLTDGVENNVARHVARRREQQRVVQRISYTRPQSDVNRTEIHPFSSVQYWILHCCSG